MARLGNLCVEGEDTVLDSIPDCTYIIIASNLLSNE